MFEAELAAREAALGPNHPDVAEALSNLAIVCNQRGEYDRALPLYARCATTRDARPGIRTASRKVDCRRI